MVIDGRQAFRTVLNARRQRKFFVSSCAGFRVWSRLNLDDNPVAIQVMKHQAVGKGDLLFDVSGDA